MVSLYFYKARITKMNESVIDTSKDKDCCRNCIYNWQQAGRSVLCEKTHNWESELYICERWFKRKEKVDD